MKRIITYGNYDLLHFGHIDFLKRAKILGDYLIVGGSVFQKTDDDIFSFQKILNCTTKLLRYATT